jgi:hypothetical protein
MRQLFLEGRALPMFFVTPGKRAFAGSHGYLDATADPVEIDKLAARFRGPKLVAVATGAISGIDIADVDPRHGGDAWYFKHHDQLPQTRVHETRGGGWHLVFKHSPSLRSSSTKLGSGVEFLSTGKLAVWWPAHAGRVLCESPAAPLPGWIHEILAGTQTAGNSSAPTWGDGSPMAGQGRGQEIPKQLYFEVLRLAPLSASVTRRHQRRVIGILSTVTTKRELRNNALNTAAFWFRELIEAGVVSRDVAARLLFRAAELCGYVAKDGPNAAMATIRSGLGSNIGGPYPFMDDTQQGAA